MHVKSFRVVNFRRLKDVVVELEGGGAATVFVGANNSGKTSATHIFQLFLGDNRDTFQFYDFTADCWPLFDAFADTASEPQQGLPRISLDIWFEVGLNDASLHRIVDLLPDLDWSGEPLGVRLSYEPKDDAQLLANYREAVEKAAPLKSGGADGYKPWPQSLTDYLKRSLNQEYDVRYYILDARRCDAEGRPLDDYLPVSFGPDTKRAARYLDSLLRVDFLNAQRHLTDSEAKGRSEDLSRRLSRFYKRNFDRLASDPVEFDAVARSEDRLNQYLATVFQPTLDQLAKVGYPGIANPKLTVRATLDPYMLLSGTGRVFYALPDADGTYDPASTTTLPDQYNGLGFKNLIFMVVEVLDFHQAWAEDDNRSAIHLIMIEEPEAHLHAPLQQVFVRKLFDILPAVQPGFETQVVVTTHSPHIIYDSSFRPIRYFCRSTATSSVPCSTVKNLSNFYSAEPKETREFLQQYIKLTHCDLFFADAAILVEGNVERLLLPLFIERAAKELQACHMSILEVGGAFAHRFRKLLAFLGLPALVITDLDSVQPATADADDSVTESVADEDDEQAGGTSCLTTVTGALTANQTLLQWLPGVAVIKDLLDLPDEAKLSIAGEDIAGLVRVAYQTSGEICWAGATAVRAGRTLEEAFALENLAWTQALERKGLGLRIATADKLQLDELHQKLFARVQRLDKTRFALALMAEEDTGWAVPRYIADGLAWLRAHMQLTSEPPAPGTEPEVIS